MKKPYDKFLYRQLLGASNREHGKRFEERIDVALQWYERSGDAVIEKTPEPMRPIKDLGGGRFVAHYEKAAQPDYKGTLRGGRSVVFEAKFTSTEKLSQSRVTSEQAARMDVYSTAGAWCFIVAGFNNGSVYRILWEVWRDMKSHFGRQYVTQKDISSFRVPVNFSGIPLLLSK